MTHERQKYSFEKDWVGLWNLDSKQGPRELKSSDLNTPEDQEPSVALGNFDTCMHQLQKRAFQASVDAPVFQPEKTKFPHDKFRLQSSWR